MRRLARWHIWLGWLTGVPLLFWTLSGLVMVARPIEEVRGEQLRRALPPAPLPAGADIAIRLPDAGKPVVSASTRVEQGQVITRLTYADDSIERFDADGRTLPPLTAVEARLIVSRAIVGGDRIMSMRLTDAADPPVDFRRPSAAWQAVLADGTHVYVARDTGEIAAVRTRFWRVFDWFWGLHIMDLKDREDTHHPLLIAFAALALATVLIGLALLFRRRSSQPPPAPQPPGASA